MLTCLSIPHVTVIAHETVLEKMLLTSSNSVAYKIVN